MFSSLHTVNLYKADEVISALQKSIRRSDPQQALFWAGELYNTGLTPLLYSRLFTILVEDIGIAEPMLPLSIWELFRIWKLDKKKKESDLSRQLTLNVVYTLAKAHKNRLADSAICAIQFMKQPNANWSKEYLPVDNILNFISQNFQTDLFSNTVQDTNDVDLSSALVRLAACIEQGDLENSLFFGNWIGHAAPIQDNRNLLANYLDIGIKDSSKELGQRADLYTWYLLLKMAEGEENLFPLLRSLYVYYIYKLGTPRLHLAQAIVLSVLKRKLNFEDIPLLKAKKNDQLFFYNPATKIEQRRKFKMPEYAVDKHTQRGKGSSQSPNTIRDLHQAGDLSKINTRTWSAQEIEKSHGDFRKFEAYFNPQINKASRWSYFFDVAAELRNKRTGVQGEDPFHNKARNFYLKMEQKYTWQNVSSREVLKRMKPILLEKQKSWAYV